MLTLEEKAKAREVVINRLTKRLKCFEKMANQGVCNQLQYTTWATMMMESIDENTFMVCKALEQYPQLRIGFLDESDSSDEYH
jgi:hypothetical protein